MVKDDTIVVIDGTEYVFDADGVRWPNVSEETNGAILEAYREDGELYITVTRFYSDSCSEWDTKDYHEVIA